MSKNIISNDENNNIESKEAPRERPNIKRLVLKYGISFVFASALTILALWLRDFFTEDLPLVDKYRFLSDAFTIPGVTLICFGCLIALSNKGALSAIGYALRWTVQLLIPLSKKNNLTYHDYRERRKKVEGYFFLFHVGFLFLAVGIVFIFLFYQVY